MKFEAECFECGKTFDYTAMNLDVKNRVVKCPHCNEVQTRHPAWDKQIIDLTKVSPVLIASI